MPVDESYRRQVSLLIKIVPLVAKETVFALKGGTAINLFLRNMPRLSVDIDLTYLPVKDRASARALRSVPEGIQDGHVEMREIAFVPSGHGEAVNASCGGDHGIFT